MPDIAEKIADKIIADITDRNGIGDEWYQIGDAIQQEIRAEWVAIINRGMEMDHD